MRLSATRLLRFNANDRRKLLPFLFLMMQRALIRTTANGAVRALLIALPFAYVVLDLLENAAVILLLHRHPERLQLMAVTLRM